MSKLALISMMLALLGVAWGNQEELDVVPSLGKIMAIKQFSDNAYFPSMEVVNALDVGEDDKASEVEEHRMHDAKAEGLLAKAADSLSLSGSNLGEMQADSTEQSQEERQLFARLKTRNPARVASTISRVVRYLGGMAHDGKRLNQKELDEARKWYIDSTAVVLGRYAYDDTESKMKVDGAHDVSGLKSRAKAAKKGMDDVDAARHMHKMGADKGMKYSGLNILELLERTGRLARFLSEVETAKVSVSTLPNLCRGAKCPPARAMNRIQRHVMKTEEEQEMHAAKRHVSKLAKLQKRESDITATINKLMQRVARGDPITGRTKAREAKAEKQMMKKAANSADGELKVQLNAAANKEDKARIVEAAGDIAEHKITNTMHAAAHPKQQKKRSANDVVVPVRDLTAHATTMMNIGLGRILHLFKKRHAQHTHLSTKEHKRVGNALRSMAAHLMQVNQKHIAAQSQKQRTPPVHRAAKAVAQHKSKLTKKAVTKPKKVKKSAKTWAHKGEVAAEQKAMDHGTPEAPSQQGSLLPKGSVVSKFIWNTLGKRGAVRVTPPKTLAELLKGGVSLMNGGQLHFLMHP